MSSELLRSTLALGSSKWDTTWHVCVVVHKQAEPTL